MAAAAPLRRASRGPRWTGAALGAGTAGALAVVFLADPATASFYPPCAFRLLTGLLCPGCGGTRALHQLLHGRPVAALALNPLLPLYLGAFGWVLLAQFRAALGRPPLLAIRVGEPRPAHAPSRWSRLLVLWPWALLALILAFWVLRNLPGWPHALGGAAAL